MFNSRHDLTPIIAAYPVDYRPISVVNVSGSGFSGSNLWKLQTPQGPLCLRRWPSEHPTADRLRWIHDVLKRAVQAGFPRLPLPIRTSHGDTFSCNDGRLWQLEPWMSGNAIDERLLGMPDSAPLVEAALTTLAEFHRALAFEKENRLPESSPPGLQNRRIELDSLLNGGLERLAQEIAADGSIWPEMAGRASPLLAAFRRAASAVTKSLQEASGQKAPIQACIRDIHWQHVLFEAGEVTGIVDFGAMDFDHVAADIARLLGSLAGDEIGLRHLGIEAYCRVHPLSDQDRRLIELYNDSEVLLSGIHWLQWIYIDGRQFENRPDVLARCDEIFSRLVQLVARQAGQGALIV